MTNRLAFSNSFNHTTIFAHSETSVWLTSLWNIECGLSGTDTGPVNTRGLCVLETANQRYEVDDFQLTEFEAGDQALVLSWQVADTGLFWSSR